MRYAQTVRFNLSTDREKIDSSSLEVQAAIDLTNAASGEKTLTGTETGEYLNYLIERTPQRDDNPDEEFIIINKTNESIELGSDITFTEKVEVTVENPDPTLSYLHLNGGKMNLYEGDATLQISNVQNTNDVTPTNMSELTEESFSMKYTVQATNKKEELIFDANKIQIIDGYTNTANVDNQIDIEPNKISHTNSSGNILNIDLTDQSMKIYREDSSGNVNVNNMSELTDESFSMKYTDPVSNDIDELIFNSNSLSLIYTNNNVEENRIDIEPNKISFTTKTEELTSTSNPNPAITGVDNTQYNEVTIQLNDTPHETGPEYKLCVTTYLDGSNSQDLAFSMNINVGTWFSQLFSSDYTQLATDLSTFTTGTDIITFSKLSSSITNNLFYRRDISSNEISIAWRTAIATGLSLIHI